MQVSEEQRQQRQRLLNIGVVGYCLLVGLIWKASLLPITAIVLGLLPVAIIFAMRLPFYMILLFFIFSFFRIHEVHPQLESLKLPLLFSLGALGGLCYQIFISEELATWWSDDFKPLLLFAGLVTVTLPIAHYPSIAFAYFNGIYWKIIVMTFGMIWLMRSQKEFYIAAYATLLGGLIVADKALYNAANKIDMVEETRVSIGRSIGSVLGDPNDLALVLMFPLAYGFGMIFNKVPWYIRLFGLVCIVVLFSAILATQSRGGLLGFLGVAGIFVYRRIQNKMLFFVGGACTAVMLYAVAGISDRQSGGAAEEGLDASAKGRLIVWESGFNMGIQNPLWGVGLNNFVANSRPYATVFLGKAKAVHSTWFGVLGETGLLGYFFFIWFVVTLIRRQIHSISILETLPNAPPMLMVIAESLLAGITGVLIAGTFLTFGFVWPIYILAALIIAFGRLLQTRLIAQYGAVETG